MHDEDEGWCEGDYYGKFFTWEEFIVGAVCCVVIGIPMILMFNKV